MSMAGYRQRTAIIGIGYLMPQKSWKEWEIAPGNAAEVARELAGSVRDYSRPWLDRLASNPHELVKEAQHLRRSRRPQASAGSSPDRQTRRRDTSDRICA
jgi:hypothetical protein